MKGIKKFLIKGTYFIMISTVYFWYKPIIFFNKLLIKKWRGQLIRGTGKF